VSGEAILTLLIGAGSLLFAFLAWRESRKSVQASKEQLELAHRQESRRPQLVVEEVRLLEVEDVPDVREELDGIEEERQADREDEERRSQGFMSEADRLMWEINRSRARGIGETYEGDELPHNVLRIRLRNEGTVTATGIEAIVYLEANHLEPLEYFADVEEVSHHPDENPPHGVYTARFGGRDLDLPPGLKHHDLQVAVLVRSPGTTEVVSVLSTATTSVEDKKELVTSSTSH
jgi:hypothetical protein